MSDKKNREQLPLFDFIPEADPGLQSFNSLPHRIWTEHKARLVERYLYYFIFITRHGTYIDGFAGQQYPGQEHSWAAREVIESRPRWLRNFFLCDIDPARAAELRAMVSSQPPPDRARKEPPRQIEVECADFNIWVDHVLDRGLIGEKEATFALLDQRTFECLWSTVAKLARHKRGNKIELFYFLPIKWLHRALDAKEDIDAIERWWGNSDWRQLADLRTETIKTTMTKRFKDELGYRYAYAWPIFEREEQGGAVMYYMIHASDHTEGPKLMARAYKNALGAREPPEQLDLQYPAPA